jgi:hypothetical protein
MQISVEIMEDRKAITDATNSDISNLEGKWMKCLLLSIVVTLVAMLSLNIGIATAENPHFVSTSESVDAAGHLDCGFKIAGLGDNVTITVTCTADASAVYGCINKGGKNPSAANKRQETAPVSGHEDVTSGKNGQVTGSVDVAPPPSTLDCPNGQTLKLCSVSYTDIELSAAGLTVGLPDLNRNFNVASNCP